MKSLFTSALACLLIVGCSTSTNESDLQGSKSKQPAKIPIADYVTSIKGEVTDVTHLVTHSGPAVPGYARTIVTVDMNLGCFDKLALFSSKVSIIGNKVEIHAAAYSLAKKASLAAFCQPNIVSKTISFEGYVAKDDINVIWMEAPSSALKVGDTGAYAITTGKIVDIKEICPHVPGELSCEAIGSTATLNLTLNGCADTLGNVSHQVKMLGNGKAEIIVSAVGISNEVSMRARCAAMPTAIANLYVTEHVTKNATLDLLK
jgi:hypothetical protein